MAASISYDGHANAWGEWRRSVVAVIQHDLGDVLVHVEDSDVDWEAWRPLYDAGRSPQAAVDYAFLRNVQKSSALFDEH